MLHGPPALARETVIIVDADVAVLSALRFSLELEGYAVETHLSVTSLGDSTLPQSAACLVIDDRLTGFGGLELLRQLRARHVDLPAILLTGRPRETLRARSQDLGAIMLEKPLVADALLAAIRAALTGPETDSAPP